MIRREWKIYRFGQHFRRMLNKPPLIYSSGLAACAAWDFVYKQGKIHPEQFLTKAFHGVRNTISHKNHFVVSVGEEIVGTIVVYFQPKFLLLTAGTALNIFREYKLDEVKVALRGLTIEGMIRPPKAERLYLGHIAVADKWRKKGNAASSIRHAVKRN
ncbi:hypothetical protein LEP1GSC050_0766 [Leptospira broomii serovar Hurstbridge str. 5399]|uniref:N-acetyltransferase domain-containing protein n=1 Tax=Leptospira broomii serovar Hurstbridge str. 5399 TaxID=1049789 RepID=T0GND1_9LEPT|nr:hypothetical protein [Leptospira broomii]EQA46848.1 hypothetical protein LEP1GSC050_0766 [Leptospira broomii serovar Hurstbridge str. 5399]